MADTAVDPPLRAIAALRPYLQPVVRHAGWFGFFLVLAPVVGPRGYGLFILALSGIAIAEALLTETTVDALCRLPALDERHLSTGLVTTLAAGAMLSLMLYGAARAVGAMSDDVILGDLFRSLSLLPMLGALAILPRAMLRREHRRAPFAAAEAAGLAAGGGVAVALAWAGAGPWSLVAQIVVQRFLECAVLWGMVSERVGIAWSRPRFAELIGALDLRALGGAWPAMARFGPCLAVGLSLGPTAAGLYLLASRLAEALGDICLAREASLSRDPLAEIVRRACQAIVPAVLASALLAIAAPPLLDVRWWGAVRPAQILLLGAIPGAVIFVRKACGGPFGAAEARWGAAEALGGVGAAALAAPYGLSAVAAVSLMLTVAVALASLWPIERRLGARWREMAAAAWRPCAGAAAAALLLGALAEPVGFALEPVPALALLVAAAWLCGLVIRGAPPRAEGATPPLRRRFDRANPA
jgi:teichuronic acid exporter